MQGVGGVRCHQRHQHHRRRRHHQHHQHHRLSKYLVKPLPGTWVPPWPMATLIGVASPHLVLLHGPTHALAVPAELQAGFLLLVAEERTAGRLAQASREFKQRLPQQPACSRFVKRAAWRRKPRWKPTASFRAAYRDLRYVPTPYGGRCQYKPLPCPEWRSGETNAHTHRGPGSIEC